jgi:hypothetical protein
MPKNNIPFHLLKIQDYHFPRSAILDMKYSRMDRVGFVVDDLTRGEINVWHQKKLLLKKDASK